MSWGVAMRNAVGVGLGGIISFVTGYASDIILGNLKLEDGFNILLEDSSLIELE